MAARRVALVLGCAASAAGHFDGWVEPKLAAVGATLAPPAIPAVVTVPPPPAPTAPVLATVPPPIAPVVATLPPLPTLPIAPAVATLPPAPTLPIAPAVATLPPMPTLPIAPAVATLPPAPKAIGLPPCSVENMGYNSTEVKPLSHVLPLCQHDCSAQCQQECGKAEGCAHYMYYKNSGGCWLFGQDVELVDMAGVISGPLKCEFIDDATNATKVIPAVVEPALRPKAQVADVFVNTTAAEVGSKGPFDVLPWWGWLLISLAVALCGVFIIVFACCCGRTEKKSTKTKRKAAVAPAPAAAESADLEAAAPLLTTEPVQTFASFSVPQYEVAPPVITSVIRVPGSTPMSSFIQAPAEPVAVASPVSTQKVLVAPPQYVQAAPVQYATQTVVAPQYVQAAPAQYATQTVVAPPQYVETVVAPAQYVQAPAQYATETIVAPAQYVQAPTQYATETIIAPAQYVDAPQEQQVPIAAAPPAQPLYMEPIATPFA